MNKFYKNVLCLISVVLIIILITGCSKINSYSQKGWKLLPDIKNESLTIEYEGLAVILKNTKLCLKKDGKIVELSDWTVKKQDNQMLTITTNKPEITTWQFIVTEGGLNINSSVNNSYITGIAPASGARIPARVASQDNGVIYNSLGFVSAKNIYNLFDRKTNIIIQFPRESELTRNVANEQLMNVTFPLLPGRGSQGYKERTNRGIKTTQGVEISLILNYYTEKLGLQHYEPYWPQHSDKHPFITAPTGWLSWYCYYMPAKQEDILKETDALAEKLKPYGLEYVQLDATFTRGEEANWLEWDKKNFPNGGKWLMQYIKNKGLKPGLWVNVYGANYENPAFGKKFPEGKYPENWFLHDKQGNVLNACCSADATVVQLDYSNPKVIQKHLKPLLETLVNDWGIEYLKDAGHGRWQWSFEENRVRVYDPSLEGRDLYWKVQDVVREIMGPGNWILGCDAEGGADYYSLGFGPFDSNINTWADVYNIWEEFLWGGSTGTKMHLATMLSANYLNDIVLYNDPDATMVRPPLTMAEAMNNVSSISLTGQSYTISDFMAQPSRERINVLRERTRWGRDFPQLIKKLSEERTKLYEKTMPAMDITPIDLFPYKSKAEYSPLPEGFPNVKNMPRALDLKVNAKSGIYDVVAVYNWSEEKSEKVVSFAEDLGLDSTKSYLVFDFWNQELKGIFKKQFQSIVPVHGCQIFLIRTLSNQPQLLATSRHITSAYSIKNLEWNLSKSILSGTSQTVANDVYSLFIYLPEGISVSNVETNAANLSFKTSPNGVLNVSFQGQKAPVDWTIEFLNEVK
ncbi:MAG: alpha-galactosidase [Bacteroidetes bacterium]|nr:alpha-galactosidase [Bacteroidota bacterium]